MLDVRRLRYFKAIADCGSMAAASRRLNIAQPSLSGHIARLEEDYGLALFARFSRGVTLTAAGERLLAHAADILAAIDRAEAELRRLGQASARRRPIRIGLLHSWGSSLTPALIAAAAERLPEMVLQIVELRAGDAVRALERGELDLAVVLADLHDDGLAPIVREPLLFVSRQAGRPAVRFADLPAEPLVLPPGGNHLRQLIDATAATLGVEMHPILEIDGLDTIKGVLKTGAGASIMPWHSIRNEYLAGTLHISRIYAPEVLRDVYLGGAKGVEGRMWQSFYDILHDLARRSIAELPELSTLG